jgi:hypothetical protein
MVQSRFRFLVFPWIWAFIHSASPGHPRSPGVRSGTTDERKAGTGPLYQRENTPNPTIWSQIPLSLPSLLCRRRHHPSPIRRPVA